MKKYHAIGASVLLRPTFLSTIKLDDVTGLRKSGSIIVPENARVKEAGDDEGPFKQFRVVSKGPGCVQVEVGNLVIVNTGALMRIPAGGEDLAYVLESNIAAIVEEVPDAVAPPPA